MQKWVLLCLGLALLLPATSVQADHPGGATMRDIRLLQDDLENLEQTLDALDPADSRTVGLRDRAGAIQDDIVILRDQIQRHQRSRRAGLGATKSEVDRLRQRIEALQDDVDVVYAGRFPSRDLTLPAGTQVHVRLEQAVSSRTARLEDRVEAAVDMPVRDQSGRILIPAGTRVLGTVTEVDRARRPLRGGELKIAFDSIFLDNVRTDLRTRVVSIDEDMDRSETAGRAGVGAVLGAVLGGLLEGKKGALIGLVIGGTGGVVSSRGEEVNLPEGTLMTLVLDQPLSVRRL